MAKSNDKVVTIAAKDRAAYTRARNAFTKASGSFRDVIGRIAKAYFDGPVTVAEFAKAVGEDLSMAKGVTAEQKAERNAIRARIHDGLKVAEMLKVNPKASKAQRKPRQAKGAASAADKAAEAAEAIEAANAKAPTQAELFAAFAGIVSKASRPTLERMANAIASQLAAKAKEA